MTTELAPHASATPLPARLVRLVLGLTLLTAAVLKVYQLASEPVDFCLGLRCRMLPLLEAMFELAMGLWLLSGLLEFWSRLAATVCFAAFLCVTVYHGVKGDASCGCFGKVAVNPWITAGLDAAAVVALVWVGRLGQRPAPPSRLRLRWAVTIALGLAGAAAATMAVVSYHPGRLADDGTFAGDAGHVVLEPARWPGRPFPLLAHIDTADRLRVGRWRILLYRWNCPQCEQTIAQLLKQPAVAASAHQVALVELPPYAPTGKGPVGPDCPFLTGKLSDQRQWYLTTGTPTAVYLSDGQVEKVDTSSKTFWPDGRVERKGP